MLTSVDTVKSFSCEMEDILEKQALDVTLPMVLGGLGGVGGGLAAYKSTRDPDKKVRNAIMAALLAGPGAYAVTKALQGGGGPSQAKADSGPPRSYVQGHVVRPGVAGAQASARPTALPDKTTQLMGIPVRRPSIDAVSHIHGVESPEVRLPSPIPQMPVNVERLLTSGG